MGHFKKVSRPIEQTRIKNNICKKHYYPINRMQKSYIPVLIASTGSNFEAEIAGRIPEITPTIMDNPEPIKMFQKLKTNSNSKTLVSNIESNQTIIKPIVPPITHRIIASNKNWNSINLFLAPNDF